MEINRVCPMNRYHVKAVGCDHHVAHMADVGVMLALLEYDLLQHYPSAISAAAVAFASLSFGRHWSRDIEVSRSGCSLCYGSPTVAFNLDSCILYPCRIKLDIPWRHWHLSCRFVGCFICKHFCDSYVSLTLYSCSASRSYAEPTKNTRKIGAPNEQPMDAWQKLHC